MKKRVGIGLAGCALLIALDRITKAWAAQVLGAMPGAQMEVWPGIFHFHYVENTGAAFGILGGMRWLTTALTLLFVLIAGALIWRQRRTRGVLAFGTLLMAGGLSHLYDRLLGRNIVDFIEIDFVRFAIFNVADICICAGAIGLTGVYLWQENRNRRDTE